MLCRILLSFCMYLLCKIGFTLETMPSHSQLEEMRLEQFERVCKKHNINELFAAKLRQLEGFKIVIIADDSSSMNELAQTILKSDNPYSHKLTRWDELKTTIEIIVEIAAVLDKSGVDLLFLNRSGMTGITNSESIHSLFVNEARGSTPIVPALHNVFNNRLDTKRLVIIATDGKPTDQYNRVNIPDFYNELKNNRSEQDFVTIVACTDEIKTMEYLNEWDLRLPHLDVVDNFTREKREIQRIQGQHFNFSFGDYIVKILLGPIDPFFDSLDERPLHGHAHEGCKCVLF